MKFVAIGLGIVVLAGAGIVGAAMGTEYRPAPIEPTQVVCPQQGEALKLNQPFQVVSWNLQYGASRNYQFFYDGGDAVHVSDEHVRWTVDSVNAVLSEIQPKIMLLQEVDRGSKRTGMLDQHQEYVAAQSPACHTSAPYHKSPYVPSPGGDHLGRVDMELSILTTAPMLMGERIQLAMLEESKVRRMFNLKRALLWAEVEIEGWDQPLAIAQTHLSAFSYGDGTLERQVAQLQDWMESRPDGQPWILAGDFNLLPPGDDKMRLEHERDLYSDEVSPVDVLFDAGFQEVFGDDQLNPEHRTYLSYGTDAPDRKIDYMFIGGPIHVLEAEILGGDALQISDHLPMRVELVIGDAPAEPVEEEPVEEEPVVDPTDMPAGAQDGPQDGDAQPSDAEGSDLQGSDLQGSDLQRSDDAAAPMAE